MVIYLLSVQIDGSFMIDAIEHNADPLTFVRRRHIEIFLIITYTPRQISTFRTHLFVKVQFNTPVMRKLDRFIDTLFSQTELPIEIKILPDTFGRPSYCCLLYTSDAADD